MEFCQRCKKAIGMFIQPFLVVSACLCPDCRNDFDVTFRPHRIFQEALRLAYFVRMRELMTMHDGQDRTGECVDAHMEMLALSPVARTILDEWIAKGIDPALAPSGRGAGETR